MAEQRISLTTDQLFAIVGTYYMGHRGCSTPLQLALSAHHRAAEELRVASMAMRNDQDDGRFDLSNVAFGIAERLEAVEQVRLQLIASNEPAGAEPIVGGAP